MSVTDVLFLVASALVIAGVWMIFPPVAFMVTGALLGTSAVLYARTTEDDGAE